LDQRRTTAAEIAVKGAWRWPLSIHRQGEWSLLIFSSGPFWFSRDCRLNDISNVSRFWAVKFSLSPLLYNLAGTKFALPRFALRSKSGENIVIGRQYFVRQAATLLEFAQSTNDPELAAALIERASSLLDKIDESNARPDPSPQAPDVQLER
jgi:hypothetical protein